MVRARDGFLVGLEVSWDILWSFLIHQSFYAGALQTCLASKSRLIKILEPSELRELEATRGVDVVLSKMSDVLKQIEKKSNKSVAEQRTAKFVNGFSDFVVKSGGIVATLLPQSPEYTVTYGIIVLIFQVCSLLNHLFEWTTQSLASGFADPSISLI